MNCQHCQSSRICKIYEMVKSYQDITDITVENCLHYTPTGTLAQFPVEPLRNTEISPITQRTRAMEEIASISDRIKEVYKANEEPEEESSPEEAPMPTCAVCDKTVSATTCSICGKAVCSDCTVFTPDNKDYCEECWDNL